MPPAQHGVPLRGLAYRRVLDAAVEAKHALSLHATTVSRTRHPSPVTRHPPAPNP